MGAAVDSTVRAISLMPTSRWAQPLLAEQVSANTGKLALHDEQDGQQQSRGGKAGRKSGVDKTLIDEESAGSAALSPVRGAAAQGSPEKATIGTFLDSDVATLPDASERAAPGKPSHSPTGTLPSTPPANETEDGSWTSPSEEHAPSSVQEPDCSGSDRPDDPTDDGESRPLQHSLATAETEIPPIEARISEGNAREQTTTSPPGSLRYKVVTGCIPDEANDVVEADAVASSRSSRACGLDPTMGVRSDAIGVGSDANNIRPSSASLRCGVVTGCLSDEVRGGVAVDSLVSSRSSRACVLENATDGKSEVRVGSCPNDNKPSSVSPRYRVVTGCLSDEVRGVMASDVVVSSRTPSACGLDSTIGVRGEAQTNTYGSDNTYLEAATGVPSEQAALCASLPCSPEVLGAAVTSTESDNVELEEPSLLVPSPQAEQPSRNGPDSNVDDSRQGHSSDEQDKSGVKIHKAEEGSDAVHSLALPIPQPTPPQDPSDSIDEEVGLKPQPSSTIAEVSAPRSPTETLDDDNISSRHHPDNPNGMDIRQPGQTLETDAALSTKVEERIDQGANRSSLSSPSFPLRRAVVAHYLADKFRDTVAASMEISARHPTNNCHNFGLKAIPSPAPPGYVPATVPATAVTDTDPNDTGRSASSEHGGDVSLAAEPPLAAGPPLAAPEEVKQVPADQIEPSFSAGEQEDCNAEQNDREVDGDANKEGSAEARQAETPTPPIAPEETPLRSAAPENDPEINHTPPASFEPLASAGEAMSRPQEGEAQSKVLRAGAADARADAVVWLARVGGRAKSVQAKASEDRAGAVVWLAEVGSRAKSTQAQASENRAGAMVWLAEVGGRAKSTQAEAREHQAGAVAWLRETGERAVSLQARAEAARVNAVEWLASKGATELQRATPTEQLRPASQQQLQGDGVDQRTHTAEAEPSDENTVGPSSRRSETSTSGDCERGSPDSPKQQPIDPSVIDVAGKAGQVIRSKDTVRSEDDKGVAPPCLAEMQRVENEPVATILPLLCQSAISVVEDVDIEPPVDRPAFDDRLAPHPSLEVVAATARLSREDPVAQAESGPQESSQMLTLVGGHDWARVSLSRTPPFDALNSPSIALRWDSTGGQNARSLPPDVGSFGGTASSATIADKVFPVAGSAMASTATAAAGGAVNGCPAAAAVPSNNGGSEWVEFFAPPHRMAPTGDAYGTERVCSAEASASTTARRISTGSTLTSYGSGETGGGLIPRRDGDQSRAISEMGGHPEVGGAGCGGHGTEVWTPPPTDPRNKRDCKRWSKAAERSRRYTRRWESFLSRIHRHFDSEVSRSACARTSNVEHSPTDRRAKETVTVGCRDSKMNRVHSRH